LNHITAGEKSSAVIFILIGAVVLTYKEFLSALFEGKPDESYLLLWTLAKGDKKHGHKSQWFKSINSAANHLEKRTDMENVYIGCGLSPKNYGIKNRCEAENIIGIPGFYADIDIKGPAHKNQNLPETIEEALSIVECHGFDPTLIINSGHGIQAWWLFKEPLIFDSKEEKKDVESMLRRLTATLRSFAKESNWEVDGIHDLSRVLRIPNTINVKPGCNPIKTSLISFDPDLIYNDHTDFKDLFIEDSNESITISKNEKETIINGLVIDPAASAPPIKLDGLLDVDVKFKATWLYQRKFKKDNTSSAYHYSLANFVIRAGWNDQEIADLIIEWHRRHNLDMKKVLRPMYIAHTILKIRKDIGIKQTDEEFTALQLEGGQSGDANNPAADTPEVTQRKKDLISKKLEIMITKIEKYIGDNPTYTIFTAKGNVENLTIDDLSSPTKLKNKIASITDFVIKTHDKKEWRGIQQMLLDIAIKIFVDQDSFERNKIENWVGEYLEGRDVSTPIDIALDEKKPFMEHNKWFIFCDDFFTWVSLNKNFLESDRKLAVMLRKSGAVSVKKNYINAKQVRTSRTVWKIR